MTDIRLQRAVPTESWHMILQFDSGELRLLDMSQLRRDTGWEKLAYPQHAKRFTLSPEAIDWPAGGTVTAPALYRRSEPVDREQLEHRVLRLCYRNVAPTEQDPRHHVYEVSLARFSSKPFRVGESIGGGFAERGGSNAFTLAGLLEWPWWRQHFELAGCAWAIATVEALQHEPGRLPDVLDRLVAEACRTNGLPEAG